MKEEYEAQERERIAALRASRGQDEDDPDDEVEEETLDVTDFDGVMWGFPTGGAGGKPKPAKKQGEKYTLDLCHLLAVFRWSIYVVTLHLCAEVAL